MFWLYPSLAVLLLGSDPLTSGTPVAGAQPAVEAPSAPAVTLGLEVLLSEHADLLRGKKVGLVTHPAAVDANWVPSVDRLVAAGKALGFKVVQLYGPEHGIRGFMSAGEKLGADVDPHTNLPVENLFGLGKKGRPSAGSLKRIDLLLIDLQDLGSRTYTYISTLGEVMEAARDAGKKVIVLDRPNPYGGLTFEGPVLNRGQRSFVGWATFPVTHGLTIGEVARYYRNVEGIACDLEVIPMKGWRRTMDWTQTGLRWVPTSPGIPHVDNAWLYTATGMVGGVTKNVSEGVGTTLPFEQVGAEWVEAPKLEAALTALKLPGVLFRATSFRPQWFNFKGKVLHGVQLMVTDPSRFRPIRTALALLVTLEQLWPEQIEYRDNFARIWGSGRLQELIPKAKAPLSRALDRLEAPWKDELEAFAKRREAVLLYP